jgi:hypothetical protein
MMRHQTLARGARHLDTGHRDRAMLASTQHSSIEPPQMLIEAGHVSHE